MNLLPRPLRPLLGLAACSLAGGAWLSAAPPVIPQIPEMQLFHQGAETLLAALQGADTNATSAVLPDLFRHHNRLSESLEDAAERLVLAADAGLGPDATPDQLLGLRGEVDTANLNRISALHNASLWRLDGDTNALDEAITNLTDVIAQDTALAENLPGWLTGTGSAQLPADLAVSLETPSELGAGDLLGLRVRVRNFGDETATNTVVTLAPSAVFKLAPMRMPLGNLAGRTSTAHVFLVTVPAVVDVAGFRATAFANNAQLVMDYQPMLINTNAP
jgi:hypothetical protein